MNRIMDAMQFESLADLIHMDGYGPFVWTAYGLTLVVLLASVWWPMVTKRKLMRAAHARMRREQVAKSQHEDVS